MPAVTYATNSPSACGQHTIRPGLLPGEDADARQGMSVLSVSRSRQGLASPGTGAWFILISPVEYCDAARLRLMVRLTRADDLNGDHESTRRVVLRGVAPHLRAVLGVLGWDRAPGLASG